MPDPITWYTLSRTVLDIQTIMESIDAKMLEHNQDPSAHGQTDEGIFTHRNDDEIDHPPYSIYNIKQNPATRVIRAFVDSGGAGDFYGIQEAIEYVRSFGGGKVFIRDGTYIFSDNLIMYSGIKLEGESRDGVILDFNSNAKYFKAIGGLVFSPAGTVSVTTDDATVTGAGSDFENEAVAGDYILVNDVWYKIASITDGTHLELEGVFRGAAQVGLTYVFSTPLSDLSVKNLTITGVDTTYGAQFYAIINSSIENIMFKNNEHSGVRFTFMSDCSVKDVYSMFNGGLGIHLQSTQSTYFVGLSALSNNDDGIQIDGNFLRDVKIIASNSSHNSGHGFDLNIGSRINLIGCNAVDNDANGFNVFAISYSALAQCEAQENDGHGFALLNTSNRNRIVTNKATDNGDDGIYIAATALKNIVTNNVATGNTNEEIDNDAADTILDNNQVA